MVFGVFKQHKKLLFSLAFFAVFGLTLQIFAAPPTTTYSQGETLDPSCIPGSTNCSVSIIPDQTGNSGKYLTTDGTTASWATISGSGISSMNGLTGATQTFASSTSGSDFSITSSGTVHTFNLPDASGSARGLVTTGTQTFAGAKTFTGAISASNLSGTNTGDQTITLSGDISGSGTGAITTTIGALKVTNAMLAGSIAASKLVGSDIATVGTITSGTWSGTTIAVSKGGTGLTSGTAGGVLAFTGSTTIASSLAGTSGQALISAGNAAVPTWYAPTAGSVLFAGTSGILQQDNSNFFWDDTNNRLGIGTTSPSSALHVSGVNTTNSQARIGSLEFQTYAVNNAWLGENVYFDGSVFRARNTGTGGLFYFAGDEGQFRFKTSLTAGDSWGTGFSNFKVNADGTVALGGTGMSVTNGDYSGATLVATAAGRVGIGVASPSAPLHVTGANSGADFYASVLVTGGGNIVLTGTGANSPTISLYPDINDTSAYVSNYYNSSDNAYYIQSVGLATSDIILRNFSTGAKVVMDENGKFGIGDDTPNSLLTVGTNDAFQINSSGDVTTTGAFDGPGFDYDASGNVAIGGTFSSASTNFAIDVSGAITAATGITSSGNIVFSGLNLSTGLGDVVCINGGNTLTKDSSGACAPSSARFKHDIVSVDSSLSMVNQLRPVSFKYNGSQKTRFGFIAEEVDLINPELVVRETDGITPHGVYYIDMIPLLAKSIQELDLKITPITSLDIKNPNSLGALVKQFLANAENTITDLYAKIIHSDKVETKQLCIGDTCVDENQLKQLLQQQGGGSVSPNPPVVDAGNPPTNETVPSNEEVAPDGNGSTPDPVTPIENTPQNDTPTPTE